MSFTDEDLKRVRNAISYGDEILPDDGEALLARLDAAENCLLTHSLRSDCRPNESDITAHEAWLRAKGEGR